MIWKILHLSSFLDHPDNKLIFLRVFSTNKQLLQYGVFSDSNHFIRAPQLTSNDVYYKPT